MRRKSMSSRLGRDLRLDFTRYLLICMCEWMVPSLGTDSDEGFRYQTWRFWSQQDTDSRRTSTSSFQRHHPTGCQQDANFFLPVLFYINEKFKRQALSRLCIEQPGPNKDSDKFRYKYWVLVTHFSTIKWNW